MKLKNLFTVIVASLMVVACSKEQPQQPATEASPDLASPVAVEVSGGNPAAEEAAELITADYMRDIIVEISSDAYEGRGPGSRGDVKARDYLAAEMQQLGLQPGAADGGWEQKFDLVGVNTVQPENWTFEGNGKTRTLQQWDEFIVSSGVQEERAEVSDAEVVFVGYGIQAPEYDWDDFKGADLEGKVLLIMNNDPAWDPELFEGETRLWYGRWDYKYLSAATQGAAGAIIIHTTPSAGYPFQVVQTSWTGEQFELPAGDGRQPRFRAGPAGHHDLDRHGRGTQPYRERERARFDPGQRSGAPR